MKVTIHGRGRRALVACAFVLAACGVSSRAPLSSDEGPEAGAGPAAPSDGFEPSSEYWDASKGDEDDASTAFREGPVRVFAFGSTTCALIPGNVLKCWGRNAYGLVGNRDVEEHDVVDPTVVAGIAPTMVAGGRDHACASDGTTVWCWGKDEHGALARGGPNDGGAEATCKDGARCSLVPGRVVGLSGVKQIASGRDFSCALLADGSVRCWGRNDLGQLGSSADAGGLASCSGVPCSGTPVAVPGLADVAQIAAGDSAACARTRAGQVLCWGRLYEVTYPAGSGETSHVAPVIPPTVFDAPPVEEVALGRDHACVVYGTSAVGCMGAARDGQAYVLGSGPAVVTQLTPRALAHSPFGFRHLALGDRHTCGITNDHAVWCWGATANGQIPVGCSAPVGIAVLLTNLFDATDVSAGAEHTCVARSNGDVYCFGLNDHGQLGGEIAGPFRCSDPNRIGRQFRQVTGLL